MALVCHGRSGELYCHVFISLHIVTYHTVVRSATFARTAHQLDCRTRGDPKRTEQSVVHAAPQCAASAVHSRTANGEWADTRNANTGLETVEDGDEMKENDGRCTYRSLAPAPATAPVLFFEILVNLSDSASTAGCLTRSGVFSVFVTKRRLIRLACHVRKIPGS